MLPFAVGASTRVHDAFIGIPPPAQAGNAVEGALLGVLTTYRRDPAWPESAFWAWELLLSANSTVPVDGLTTINLVDSPSPACASGRRLIPPVCLTLDLLAGFGGGGNGRFHGEAAGWSDHEGIQEVVRRGQQRLHMGK
jgi:hypothetical protein